MCQVLFYIPIYIFPNLPKGIPIYGYGFMLFLAFVACTVFASWRARREGIPKELLQDLAIWIFVCGILGARITFMIQYHVDITDFYKIWDGGLVFYGSAIGGVVGYFLAYFFFLRKHQISSWKIADIAAPCVAIGLGLGRVGCYLNGCCYGNVACPECPAVHFPIGSPATDALVNGGLQTKAGFTTFDDSVPVTVDRVEPGSPAYENGLRDGDVILKANDRKMLLVFAKENGKEVEHQFDDFSSYQKAVEQFNKDGVRVDKRVTPLTDYLYQDWPRGERWLQLKVRHRDETEETLPAFKPKTLGLNPTQLYETVSMALLFLLLMAYYPFRRHDGELFVIVMLCYSVHRFINEVLRNDTEFVNFNFFGLFRVETHMTLSQNGSILVFVAALVLGWWLWRKPVQYVAGKPVAA
jgi:prolipoprotein diacylglyceryltransferase